MFDIMDFGAIPDGCTNNANAIQNAIDACAKQGGGTIYIPAGGIFLSGRITLSAHICLHLEHGATLKASGNPNDFLPQGAPPFVKQHGLITKTTEDTFPTDEDIKQYHGLQWPVFVFLYAKDAHHITISGGGTIDGNHLAFVDEYDLPYHLSARVTPRPTLLFFEHCDSLTLQEVTIQNAPFWTAHLAGCRHVLVQGIRIQNDLRMANCDGIDIDHCQDVIITNCHIVSADDAIVLKNTSYLKQYGDCERILISGCTLTSTSCALKIGSESVSDFIDIMITNCVIYDSNRGIGVQLRDAGNLKHMIITNCLIQTRRFYHRYWGAAEPIYLTSINRSPSVQSGFIADVHITNVHGRGENGVFLYTDCPGKIKDISFSQVSITLEKNSKWDICQSDIRPCSERELSSFQQEKICGIYGKNVLVDGLDQVTVTVTPSFQPYFQEDQCFEDTPS